MPNYASFLPALPTLPMGIIVIYVVLLAAIAAINYYIYCIEQQYTAKKLGDNETWMAYVPFARNVQRMNMVDMPMWKLFFVGGVFTKIFSWAIIGLVAFMFAAINPLLGGIIGAVLLIAYEVFYYISTYKFYYIIAEKFGFIPAPTALVVMFIPIASQAFKYLIALSDRYYVGKATAPAAGSAAPGGVNAGAGASSGNIGIYGVSGMYAGAEFTMKATDEFVIGRDGTLSNIIISTNGDKVSRRHCTIRFVGGRYEVTDFSSNGTFYNNERLIKGQATPLPRGTTLVIGDKANQFRLM